MPDFFMIGAPKSGTTALYTYLSEHPSVFMPRQKEPMHFCSDFSTRYSIRSADAYRSLFANAPACKITGEASTLYLRSEVAVPNIQNENPAAKFIVMLRDPIEAVRSMHAHYLAVWVENILDLETAWAAQTDRLAGRQVPESCPDPKLLQYSSLFQYSDQLSRLFDLVPRERCHIVIFEEFFANPRQHYAKILNFLNIESDRRKRFPKINRAGPPRNMAFHKLLTPEKFLGKPLEATVRRVCHSLGFHPRTMLRRLNAASIPPLRGEFRAQLRDFFADDITRTEKLLGRNLNIWRQRGTVGDRFVSISQMSAE